MVVEPRLLPCIPTDEPDVEMRFAMKLCVEALVGRVADVPTPQIGTSGEIADEPFKLLDLEGCCGRGDE